MQTLAPTSATPPQGSSTPIVVSSTSSTSPVPTQRRQDISAAFAALSPLGSADPVRRRLFVDSSDASSVADASVLSQSALLELSEPELNASINAHEVTAEYSLATTTSVSYLQRTVQNLLKRRGLQVDSVSVQVETLNLKENDRLTNKNSGTTTCDIQIRKADGSSATLTGLFMLKLVAASDAANPHVKFINDQYYQTIFALHTLTSLDNHSYNDEEKWLINQVAAACGTNVTRSVIDKPVYNIKGEALLDRSREELVKTTFKGSNLMAIALGDIPGSGVSLDDAAETDALVRLRVSADDSVHLQPQPALVPQDGGGMQPVLPGAFEQATPGLVPRHGDGGLQPGAAPEHVERTVYGPALSSSGGFEQADDAPQHGFRPFGGFCL